MPTHVVSRPKPLVSLLLGGVRVRPTTPRKVRIGTPWVSDAATVLAYAETMVSAADRASVSSGEQDEAIHQLIALGQEKGYLRREEIDAVMPVDVTASAVLNDLLSQCGEVGIDVVRLYLADMSRVPLLTRDKEVALAKRIERGHRTVMVAISHTPSLVQQVMRLGDALREDERLIRRLVTHRHRELTATRLKRRARQVRVQIEAVRTAWADAQTRHAAWQRVPT